MGLAASPTLLNGLANTRDRSTRWSILRLLTSLGSGIGALVVARLPSAAWYMQRNLLVLLGRLDAWPDGFTPATYAKNSDARVRREALKLMLATAALRTEGVILGFRDSDEGNIRLALNAALDSCPPIALPAVQRILDDPKNGDEIGALCIRILANARAPGALERLVDITRPRRRLFGWKLAEKSPTVLAALAALAENWPSDPASRRVLRIAGEHTDPEMRAAAGEAKG
jgi:hypothetical protein